MSCVLRGRFSRDDDEGRGADADTDTGADPETDKEADPTSADAFFLPFRLLLSLALLVSVYLRVVGEEEGWRRSGSP